MSTLLHVPSPVHSKLAVVWPDDAPDSTDGLPVYEPTPGDFLYLLGLDLGLEGVRNTFSVGLPGHPGPEEWLRLCRGISDGNGERALVEARELGRAMGESGSGISEPPAGFSAAEKAAFRDGYAAGLDDFDHAETLCRDLDRERELACLYGDGPTYLTDRDIYPPGCIG